MRFFVALLLFFTALFAQNIPTEGDVPYEENIATPSKVLYLNFETTPHRVLKGEVFPITVKALCVVEDFEDIRYNLTNMRGLKLLSDTPSRVKDGKYYFDTFYFIATAQEAKLPNFEATLVGTQAYQSTHLEGEALNVISLNPKSDFSNIIANAFDIQEFKTTSYDATHNIVVFVATAKNCDIGALKLSGVHKQGIESLTNSFTDAKITYYAIIDKSLQTLSFSYFNLEKNKFMLIHIPIIVSDDSVTTQSDLKPKDQSNDLLKMGAAATVALIAFIIILWRRRYIYLIFIVLPLAYILSLSLPSKEVCVKEGAAIYLLPMSNGTVFEQAPREYHLQKESQIKGWTKVQLQDQKIGWVKNEDLCSY